MPLPAGIADCRLPIGALTSQYFANYYLDGLDRWLAELSEVRSNIRYMDDIVWWCEDKAAAKRSLSWIVDYLREERQLRVKDFPQIHKSAQGLSFCGFQIFPGVTRLSLRRKRRYQQRRLFWERQYRLGRIDAKQLQSAYAGVQAILKGADSEQWRRENFRLHPPVSG
ncbi:RNA-directed DNA polymerase [Methylomonas sp. HYX-M1]|uniref:RNA-directed DNA polymerase n=1 Tax=Methylomonas sp. HYX-M1 TaxID=3139307 RepID=UPI00345BB59B